MFSVEGDTLYTQYCIADEIFYSGIEKEGNLIKSVLCPRVVTDRYKYEIGDTVIIEVTIPYIKENWFDFLKFKYIILNTDRISNYDDVNNVISYNEEYIYPGECTQIKFILTMIDTYDILGSFSIINNNNPVLKIYEEDMSKLKFIVE